MAIDKCPHRFKELADRTLPALMTALRKAMNSPYETTLFCDAGHGTGTILKMLH